MSAPVHFAHLDGLRGVAALIVVISHASNAGLLPQVLGRGFGQIGVAVFFMLSGFLMGYLYAHRPANAATLRAYFLSRCARVLPLYYVTLLGAGAFVFVLDVPFFDIPSLAAWGLGLGLIQGPDLFWSIPVEVQFYAVFAVLWAGIWRGFCTPTATAVIASVIAAQLLGAWYFSGALYVLPVWGHLFLAGVLVAVWFRRTDAGRLRGHPARVRAWHAAAWASLPLLVWVLPQLRRDLGFMPAPPFGDPVALIAVGVVFFGALFAVGPYRILAHPALRWLGAVSFSLYLLHLPFIYVAGHLLRLGAAPALVLFTGALFGSLLAAAASLYWLERPAQRFILARFGRTG